MMKKINDFAEISPLVMKYFKRGVITNNFLTPSDYKAEIAEERLFYDEGEGFLRFFLKRDGFFIMYFYALDEYVKFPDIEEKLVCDFSGDDKGILQKNGFRVYNERVRLKADEFDSDLKADKATAKYAEAVYGLFLKSLDKYSGFIPNYTQIEKECENGKILVTCDNGVISSALRFDISGKCGNIRHLCVDEKYRGKGLGKITVSAFFAETKGLKHIVWTGSKNLVALNLYKSFGFSEDGTSSAVYCNFKEN